MTTTTAHPTHSRFPRAGFNLGLKSQSELRSRTLGSKKDDEDWYIPYTGPYESPPEPRSPGNRDRDSWGDPVYGLSDGEAFEDTAPHVHYYDDSSDRGHGFRPSDESQIIGRERARSLSSNYTASGMDHARSSRSAQRRYNPSVDHRPSVPSYVSSDVGGVGESPVPHLRQPKDRPLTHRASLASIFTFGVKSPSSPVPADRGAKSPPRKRSVRPNTTSAGDSSGNRLSTNDHRRTTSGDSHNNTIRARRGFKGIVQSINSQTTTEEDYYNSYYSTLVHTPAKHRRSMSANHSSPDSPPTQSVSSASQHPYALASTQTENQTEATPTNPKSAPPFTTTQLTSPIIPKLTFSDSPPRHPHGAGPSNPAPNNGAPHRQIKGSVSTPNLQASKNTLGVSRHVPKGIDRWLSAETWCDALFFPRPRLKIKNDPGAGWSRRVVSPPGSPVLTSDPGANQETESVPSRVLAHSRSLVNLGEGNEGDIRQDQSPAEAPLGLPPIVPQTQSQPLVGGAGQLPALNGHLRPPRPKSWSSDDLDLPSPIPSLTKVLADGQRLESERKEWQSKAFGSIGNRQARNVSRSRSKSLTANGRNKSSRVQTNMDFLAARAVHGNQNVIPVVPSALKHRKVPSQQGTTSYSSHTNSNPQTQTNTSSLIRTLTHSSKSHSRDHSRNDSWSKSALKAVKSTTVPCCDDHATTTPTDEKKTGQHQNDLENMLPKNDVQVIRPVDTPSVLVNPSTTLSAPALGPSPTPSNTSSGITDPRVGIAISTPLTDESLSRDNLRLASHPYAQGGLYSYADPRTSHEKRAEYAGPHPIQTLRPAEIPDGPAARHKLPPHVILSHPYAQASPSQDSYDERLIKHPRPDSNVPPQEKMWAPLAPGVVREILPMDLKYSPFVDQDGKMESDMKVAMDMTGITDTVGVGEALAYAVECREREGTSARDSGVGTSESAHGSRSGDVVAGIATVDEGNCDLIERFGSVSRYPGQYDVRRPTYLTPNAHSLNSPETAHTFASSPLEYRFTPRIPEFVRTVTKVPTPIMHSQNSSQRNSPRPLGSPTDLVGFQDLFYKPGTGMLKEPRKQKSFDEQSSTGSQTRLSNIPFDLKFPNQRRASGLTTLARKLSQEYDQLSNKDRTISQYSHSSSSATNGSPRPPDARRPMEGSLEFVFEELANPDSPTPGTYINEQGRTRVTLPFGPQDNIPEDVASASFMGSEKEGEESEDETEVFHLKQVGTATPSAINADHRLSYTGLMGYETERHETSATHPVPVTDAVRPTEAGAPLSPISSSTSEARVISGLQPPLTDNTRSSFYTTSTGSRMSGLSDFPIPPRDHLLSSFFLDANGRPSMQVRGEESGPSVVSRTFNSSNRLTFGAGADAEDIVQALSSQPHHF